MSPASNLPVRKSVTWRRTLFSLYCTTYAVFACGGRRTENRLFDEGAIALCGVVSRLPQLRELSLGCTLARRRGVRMAFLHEGYTSEACRCWRHGSEIGEGKLAN